jgi:hypothetical protein
VAPPPTQPLGKLDGRGKPPLAGTRRSTAAELLQEKYNVKVGFVGVGVWWGGGSG